MLPGDKPPPHSPEVEAALIGSCLVNPNVFPLIAAEVAREEFYDARHQHLFEAMSSLFNKNVLIDPVTVANVLKEMRLLENAGGADYIGSLVALSIPIEGCEHYARIIRNSAALRRMIFTAAEITSEAYNGGYDPEEFLTRSEEKLLAAGEKRITKVVKPIGELVGPALEQIEYRKANHTAAIGISSGYRRLDDLVHGFQDTDLIILAARPAMGKTSFALNVAMNAAFRQRKAVLFVSLEMGEEQITNRILCVRTAIESSRLGTEAQYLTREDMARLREAANDLQSVPLFIDDTARIGMLELRAKARRLKASGKLDMVMVDYLQLMDPSDKKVSREQQISEISRGLKAMAKELHIPVIALSQLSRAPEIRQGDKRPMLSDLRESGAIEQDADIVMFLFRPEYYAKKSNADKTGGKGSKPPEADSRLEGGISVAGLLEVIVAKHRNGPTGRAALRFIPDSMSVTDWNGPLPEEYGQS
ncbi:MAG TPA: replicative DNA helicase [Myxococcota bacterium]|nr:replicative DNA helicase [Myxococcota bacterium]